MQCRALAKMEKAMQQQNSALFILKIIRISPARILHHPNHKLSSVQNFQVNMCMAA